MNITKKFSDFDFLVLLRFCAVCKYWEFGQSLVINHFVAESGAFQKQEYCGKK